MKKMLLLPFVLLALLVSACSDDDKDLPKEPDSLRPHLTAEQYNSMIKNSSWGVVWRTYTDLSGNELAEDNNLIGGGFKGIVFMENGYSLICLDSGDDAFVEATYIRPPGVWKARVMTSMLSCILHISRATVLSHI